MPLLFSAEVTLIGVTCHHNSMSTIVDHLGVELERDMSGHKHHVINIHGVATDSHNRNSFVFSAQEGLRTLKRLARPNCEAAELNKSLQASRSAPGYATSWLAPMAYGCRSTEPLRILRQSSGLHVARSSALFRSQCVDCNAKLHAALESRWNPKMCQMRLPV